MDWSEFSRRYSLPILGEACIVCGEPSGTPHDEECPVPEHEAMLRGDELAKAIHDPKECELCLVADEVRCSCRCGCCCENLIIEATPFDARREPKIKERASPLRDFDGDLQEEAGWLLNGPGGPCVFFHRDPEGLGICEIYATRPLCCRHFNCDTSEVARTFCSPPSEGPPQKGREL